MTAIGFRHYLFAMIFVLTASTAAHAQTHVDCERDRKIFAEARDLLRADQNLLGAFHFSQLRASACDPIVASRAWFGYALAMANLKETPEAARAIDTALRLPTVADSDKRALRLLKVSIDASADATLDPQQKKRWSLWQAKENAAEFQRQLRDSAFDANRPQLETFAERLKNSPRRSPAVAGIASAILPGAGQAYVGNWQTAALAFVINAAVLAATLDFGRQDMRGATIAGAGVFSITYVGNIVSAAQSAQEFNRSARAQTESEMRTVILPELSF